MSTADRHARVLSVRAAEAAHAVRTVGVFEHALDNDSHPVALCQILNATCGHTYIYAVGHLCL